MIYTLKTGLLVGILFVMSGCGDITSLEESIKETPLNRNFNPNSTKSDLSILAQNNNDFAFKLFKKLYSDEDKNIFFSPYSISEALAMVYAGAKNETKMQIASVFNFDTKNDTLLHNSFNGLNLHLTNRDNNHSIFEVSNSIWVQKDYFIFESYLTFLETNYGIPIRNLDFLNKPESSREQINEWIEEKTHQRIKDILDKEAITIDTRVVLTNSVYFKGFWASPFFESRTKSDIFTLNDASTQKVAFMHQYERPIRYFKAKDYQALELLYQGGNTSMVIILPNSQQFEDVVSNIEKYYSETIKNLSQNLINLKMPKFEFTTPVYDIKKYLQELGMKLAFSNADFGAMTDDTTLYIDSIAHKAFIKVDENGTEASASTVVVDSNGSFRETTDFNMVRPFIFFIKDTLTNQILFMGVIKSIN